MNATGQDHLLVVWHALVHQLSTYEFDQYCPLEKPVVPPFPVEKNKNKTYDNFRRRKQELIDSTKKNQTTYQKPSTSQNYTPDLTSACNILITLIQNIHARIVRCTVSGFKLFFTFLGKGVIYRKHPLKYKILMLAKQRGNPHDIIIDITFVEIVLDIIPVMHSTVFL